MARVRRSSSTMLPGTVDDIHEELPARMEAEERRLSPGGRLVPVGIFAVAIVGRAARWPAESAARLLHFVLGEDTHLDVAVRLRGPGSRLRRFLLGFGRGSGGVCGCFVLVLACDFGTPAGCLSWDTEAAGWFGRSSPAVFGLVDELLSSASCWCSRQSRLWRRPRSAARRSRSSR